MKLWDINKWLDYNIGDELVDIRSHCSDYWLGKHVEVKHTNKIPYIEERIIGMQGTIERLSGKEVGVRIEGKINEASQYGIYWFKTTELEIVGDRSEDYKMKFNYVAIVNLVEDYHKKDYAFGLYEEDYKLTCVCTGVEDYEKQMVVVNPKYKNNRVLGVIKEIMTVDEYLAKNKNAKITAEVIGVVNTDGHIARVVEEARLKELAKKKAAIEKELETEINKRKSVEYYEKMAQQYADNPRLAELVAELKGLGE